MGHSCGCGTDFSDKGYITQMWQLCALFIDLTLLRRGPQDLPCSRNLFVSLLLTNFILRVAMNDPAFGIQGLAVHSVMLGFQIGFIKLVLKASRKENRFLQISSALLLVDIGFMLFVGMLSYMFNWDTGNHADLLQHVFVFGLWQLICFGYIFKQGFDLKLLASIGLTLFYATLPTAILVVCALFMMTLKGIG
jgi:hypothetical protein